MFRRCGAVGYGYCRVDVFRIACGLEIEGSGLNTRENWSASGLNVDSYDIDWRGGINLKGTGI
jgi:hypothetical protein